MVALTEEVDRVSRLSRQDQNVIEGNHLDEEFERALAFSNQKQSQIEAEEEQDERFFTVGMGKIETQAEAQ